MRKAGDLKVLKDAMDAERKALVLNKPTLEGGLL